MRSQGFRYLVLLCSLAALADGCGGSGGSHSSSGGGTTPTANKFAQTNLVADTASAGAATTDPNLVNPWGVSYAPGGPFWVSDNGIGLSTLYNGSGSVQPLVVEIPAKNGGKNGPVTGQVYNSSADFNGGVFIFDNEDGVISYWTGGTSATTGFDNSASGAVYMGLAMASNSGANFLYAANFSSGNVDVFDKNYKLTNSFTDSTLPAGFAPFGITTINNQIYVGYAEQNGTKNFVVPGVGNGYVDIFSPSGTLVKRLVSTGLLNAPWGMAMAPAGFGSVGGDLLVGNFGDGHINAYNPTSGSFVATFNNSAGQTLAIPGLWALIFGNGGSGGATNTLYFTAGPDKGTHGLMGSLSPTN